MQKYENLKLQIYQVNTAVQYDELLECRKMILFSQGPAGERKQSGAKDAV